MQSIRSSLALVKALVDRIRPTPIGDIALARHKLEREIDRLRADPEQAHLIGRALAELLAVPDQWAFYAETGVRSALGFWLELVQRLSESLLPPAPRDGALRNNLRLIFSHRADHLWVAGLPDAEWIELARVLGLDSGWPQESEQKARANLIEAMRALSYRIAGVGLDREILDADPTLEHGLSPLLEQNAALVPLIGEVAAARRDFTLDEAAALGQLLDQCALAVDRVHQAVMEHGVSVRLTYLMARLQQMIDRLRQLLSMSAGAQQLLRAPQLMKTLLAAEQARHHLGLFVGENVSLLARKVTDHASRHGEHYIADDRTQWWAMARSAALGGVVIAFMALIKLRIGLLHLPPLTEGIAFGTNYALGFVVIYLLGGTVATKQPAMTAAAIADTLEEAHPRELDRLVDLAQNVIRTQWVAVLGNVCLALPIACAIALVWAALPGAPLAPPAKLQTMLAELNPLRGAALWYAAIAGLGLFLSGLVSGYFDNQARYRDLAARVAHAPRLVSWLGSARVERLAARLDENYGAILGNLFFGYYLGVAGALNALTGLPLDIRHVAFSSANLGTAVTTLGVSAALPEVPMAVLGVALIALVNLAVSFALALYVALKSRRGRSIQIAWLIVLLARRLLRHPLEFFSPPRETGGVSDSR